jgi:hypothetical protein
MSEFTRHEVSEIDRRDMSEIGKTGNVRDRRGRKCQRLARQEVSEIGSTRKYQILARQEMSEIGITGSFRGCKTGNVRE